MMKWIYLLLCVIYQTFTFFTNQLQFHPQGFVCYVISDVYSGAQFDWDSLYSVFWSPSSSGVKLPTPSPQQPVLYNIYCPEAAYVLLAMAHSMVNEVGADLTVLICRI